MGEFQFIKSDRSGFDSIIHIYKVPIILGLGSIACFIGSLTLLVQSTTTVEPIQFSTNSEASASSQSFMRVTVDIEGAVDKPGVYTLPLGSRVEDIITLSGGFTDEADVEVTAKTVNRAQKVQDGMKIYIQKFIDTSHNINNESESVTTSHNDVSGIGGVNIGTISINSASQSEIETLPGIGPVTASKILSHRPYSDIGELVERKVIGPKLFEQVRNNLSL